MNKDSLGSRMKSCYENRSRYYLNRRTPVIIRVDGRAFHTLTRGADKPFDAQIISSMVGATLFAIGEMQGCKCAYVQSDEISFLLDDTDEFETQAWFDYNKSKIETIAASAVTAHFNKEIQNSKFSGRTAMFDARSFNIPKEEVPNYFVWRQKDWIRNSICMLARAHFSHVELNNKNTMEMKAMLSTKGVRWEELTDTQKYGTFINKRQHPKSFEGEYKSIEELCYGI